MSMSWSVLMVSQWPVSSIAEVAEIMAEETRPDFEEELPDEWVDSFHYIDGLPYPEEVDIVDKRLILFFELSTTELYHQDKIMQALGALGGQSVYSVASEVQETAYYWFNSQNNEMELIYENNYSENSLSDPVIEKQLKSHKTLDGALAYIIECHKQKQLPSTAV